MNLFIHYPFVQREKSQMMANLRAQSNDLVVTITDITTSSGSLLSFISLNKLNLCIIFCLKIFKFKYKQNWDFQLFNGALIL